MIICEWLVAFASEITRTSADDIVKLESVEVELTLAQPVKFRHQAYFDPVPAKHVTW